MSQICEQCVLWHIICYPSGLILFGMVLNPLAQPVTVSWRTDSGECLPWVSQSLPQVLEPLFETINSEDVNNSDEVTLLWSINDMKRVLEVGKQSPVLGLELL